MDKNTKNVLTLLVIVGAFWWIGTGGVIPQTITPTDGVDVDGVVIETGTPTVEWYATDAILGTSITPGHYRVMIGNVSSEEESNDTVNASRGDSYKICLMPNSTYYGQCVEGTITKPVTTVNIDTYRLGSVSTWTNNDPENSTVRNSVSAVDALAAGDTDTSTVCIQGATANASFGDGSVLAIFDYNANQITDISFSKGTPANSKIPSTYDANSTAFACGTAKVAYELTGPLTNQETICGTLTVVNVATNPAAQSNVCVKLYDRFLYRDSVTDKLAQGYAIESNGEDTNSGTNVSGYYYIS